MTVREGYRLSPQQQRLFQCGAATRLPAQLVVRIRGDVRPHAIATAMERVIGARPLLGAAFVSAPGRVMPLLVPPRTPTAVNVRCVVDDAHERALVERMLDEDAAPFELQRGVQIRVSMVERPHDALVFVSVPCVCADRDSLGWIAEDLALALSGASPLREEIPYEQYAEWRNEIEGPARELGDARPFRPHIIRDAVTIAAADEAVARFGVPRSAVWLAAFRLALARRGGLRFGCVVSGRTEPELVRAVGVFAMVSELPAISVEAGLAEQLHAAARCVKETTDVPAGEPQRCDHLFELCRPWPAIRRAELEIEVIRRTSWLDRFSTCVELSDDRVDVWYDAASFAGRELETIVADACTIVGRSAAATTNVTRTGADDRFVHRLFERQTTRTPANVALVDGERHVTYAEVDAEASRIAAWLHARGVGRGTLVALSLPIGAELVCWILGTLKAGAAFLPLDERLPLARCEQILAIARPAIHVQPGLPVASSQNDFTAVDLTDDDLAYVIFTSGTTGLPKGVAVSHGAIHSYIAWVAQELALTSGDHVPLHTSIAADLTLTSVLAPLCCGATVDVLPPRADGELPIAAALREGRRFALVKMTPTHLSLVLASGSVRSGAVRTLMLGGEDVRSEHVARWYAGNGGTILNEYGPTETTVGATVERIEPDSAHSIAIGRPIAGASIHVLDRALAPAAIGEVYIGGAGVARGYLGDPATTAQRFVPDLFGPPGARLYRTGDLATIRDGRIVLNGRIDAQLKIRGHRVEPAEIERTLETHPAVRQAAVVGRRDGEQTQLVAHVVPRPAHRPRALHRLPNGLVMSQVSRAETDLLFEEIFVSRSYTRHGVSISDGDIVFDVGANIGLFTLFTLLAAPLARVFAFEPSAVVHDLLRANLSRHGMTAHVYRMALSARAGEAVFTYYPDMTTMSGLYTNAVDDAALSRIVTGNRGGAHAAAAAALVGDRFVGSREPVPVSTVSRVMRDERIERIDLLKIDAEKSEADILAGIDEADWARIRQVVAEVHDVGGRASSIAENLESRGFAVIVETDPAHRSTELRQVFAVRRPFRHATVAMSTPPIARTLARELREYVAAALPASHVPAEVTIVDELPLTAAGKIDRHALSSAQRQSSEVGYVAPRGAVEATLCELFAEVLRRERIGVHDDFFELGGDSLLSLQLVARAGASGLAIAPRMLFRASTPAALAAALAIPSVQDVIAPDSDEVALTPLQQRILASNNLDAHVQCAGFHVVPGAEVAVLRNAIADVIGTHDVLRLQLARTEAGAWGARISSEVPDVIEVIELEDAELDSAFGARIGEHVRARVRAATGRMIAAAIVCHSGRPVMFAIAIHHLVMDALSWRILLEDLLAATAGRCPIPCGTAFRSAVARASRNAAAAAPLPDGERLTLVRDPKRDERPDVVSRRISWNARAARAAAAACDAGVEDLLLAAWLRALATWTERSRFTIEIEGHGRDDFAAARVVGPFARHVVVRADLSRAAGANVVADVSRAVRSARSSRSVVMGTAELAFNFLGDIYAYRPTHPLGERLPIQSPSALLDAQLLVIDLAVDADVLEAEVRYDPSRISSATATMLLERFAAEAMTLIASASPHDAERSDISLAPVQEGILYHAMQAPGTGRYVAAVTFELEGTLDRDALSRAWRQVSDAHEMLRTVLLWGRDGLRQTWPATTPPLVFLDWQERPGAQEELAALIATERNRDVSTGASLLRASVVQMSCDKHAVVLVFHHAILDGWSLALVLRDLMRAYAAAHAGRDWSARPRTQYEEYLRWAREQRTDEMAMRTFWQEYLGDAAPVPEHRGSPQCASAPVRIPRVESRLLPGGAVTPSVLVFAAWALVLHRRSATSAVTFGVALAGRPDVFPDRHEMVGLFINTLPVRIPITPQAPIAAWLVDVRERFLAVSARETTTLRDVQRSLGLAGRSLFETVVVVENYPALADGELLSAGLRATGVRFVDPSHYPLTLTASLRDHTELSLAYDDAVFPAPTIRAMLSDLARLTEMLASGDVAMTLAELLERSRTEVAVPGERRLVNTTGVQRRRVTEGTS